MKQRPLSVEELKNLYSEPVRNAVSDTKDSLTWHERFALWITNRVGSIGFFAIICAWSVIWVLWNIVAPEALRFDPYPSFVVWLFISNVIQILLLPLILVGQNLQSKSFEADAEADYALNKRTSHEIETILKHLEYQEEMIEAMHKRLN